MTSPRLPDYGLMSEDQKDMTLLHYANKRQEAWLILEEAKKTYREMEMQMQRISYSLQQARHLYHQTSHTYDRHAAAIKDAKPKPIRLTKSDSGDMD